MKTIIECVNGHEIRPAPWFDSVGDLRLTITSNCPECQAAFFALMDSQKAEFYQKIQKLRNEGGANAKINGGN
jgi:hypothetical protein